MLNWNNVLQFAGKGTPDPDTKVEKTEDEWRALLSPEEFRITRQKGTERPGTGKYNKHYEFRKCFL